ncbi:MAG: hypothetical protein K2Y27_16610 [Xanthobacteraceae bacterium]|nr:hypothetical protein [Xanthobacteraceae bacterium]
MIMDKRFVARLVVIGLSLPIADAFVSPSAAADTKIPPHYTVSGGCRPGGGYSFVASAPGHPSTYPKLILRVFKGELIGMIFEAGTESGWKPWYDQADGKPVSHGSGPAHYSQAIWLKTPPTAEQCAASKGPME